MKKLIPFLISIFFLILIAGCNENPPVNSPNTSDNNFETDLEKAILSEDSVTQLNINKWKEITGPCVITEPGVYTVIKDIQTGTYGNGIEIRSVNHVYLDLNGHTLSGSSGHHYNAGVLIDSSEWVLVDNGNITGYAVAVLFSNSSKCSFKDVVVTSGYLLDNPPPHFKGADIDNSDRIKISWNLFEHIEFGVDVHGIGSALNKIANNTFIGGTYTTGKYGISYFSFTDSPSDDIVRNNLITKFSNGITAETYNGYHKFANNRIEYYTSPYINNDSTNKFVNNTCIQINP